MFDTFAAGDDRSLLDDTSQSTRDLAEFALLAVASIAAILIAVAVAFLI